MNSFYFKLLDLLSSVIKLKVWVMRGWAKLRCSFSGACKKSIWKRDEDWSEQLTILASFRKITRQIRRTPNAKSCQICPLWLTLKTIQKYSSKPNLHIRLRKRKKKSKTNLIMKKVRLEMMTNKSRLLEKFKQKILIGEVEAFHK